MRPMKALVSFSIPEIRSYCMLISLQETHNGGHEKMTESKDSVYNPKFKY
jgi:hypothetical protein